MQFQVIKSLSRVERFYGLQGGKKERHIKFIAPSSSCY